MGTWFTSGYCRKSHIWSPIITFHGQANKIKGFLAKQKSRTTAASGKAEWLIVFQKQQEERCEQAITVVRAPMNAGYVVKGASGLIPAHPSSPYSQGGL